MDNKNIIEINGKRYDAITGNVIVEEPAKTTVQTVAKTVTPAPAPRPVRVAATKAAPSRLNQHVRPPVLDLRSSQKDTAPAAEEKKHKESKHTIKAQQHHSKVRPSLTSARSHIRTVAAPVTVAAPASTGHSIAVHAAPHRQQNSQTLMRRAVKKPQEGLKKQLHVQSALVSDKPNLIVKKSSVHNVSPHRAVRAQAVEQSKHIRKFGHPADVRLPVSIASIPVQPAPADPPAPAEPPQVTGAPSPTPTNRPVDMFEKAIQNANHFVDLKASKKHFHKKRRQQVLSIAAASLAIVVISGFALYQNTPGMQVKVAGIRAGVATNMPKLDGTGFAYNGVSTTDGKLTLGLKGGDTTAQLVQQQTNWSNDDLLRQANVGTDASGQPAYLTIQAGDKFVYRFNDTSATWINNGVWYQLNSSSYLTDEQVTALAEQS